MSLGTTVSASLCGAGEHQLKVTSSNVYDYLKGRLIRYQFRPRERLVVAELADSIKVSSTPVREALSRLCVEEYLVSVPNRGFFVRPLSVKEMRDLLEFGWFLLRDSIELSSKKREKMPLSDRPEMLPIESASCDSAAAVVYIETAYKRISALTPNSALSRALSNFVDRTHYIRSLDIEDYGSRGKLVTDIGEIDQLLHRGEISPAISCLELHFEEQYERLPSLVKEGISRLYAGTSADQ
ncbi:GntR family transcriptional regulator [Bradyrhizobium prioriisuperbiae]|uniref:GntR family transcriptional regulator n=1 Tax=Bradyrhizobium prioriisuperbiae TaxID=2854389 RepID=UPI0028EFBA7B|nr:GntR family transcriptional regulator [Bradyrhizobium prioritasuperba]